MPYEILEHEHKSRPEPQFSMKFRRAARAHKFRNEFCEILTWAKWFGSIYRSLNQLRAVISVTTSSLWDA